VPWEEDVRYGSSEVTGNPLYANIWRPPPSVSPTGLTLLYIYGGAWHFLDKDMGTRQFFRHLSAQGHTVMDISYTLAPQAKLEDMVREVKQAILWMKTTGSQRYGVDSERIVLCGCSSGAQMALLAAYTPDHPAYQPAAPACSTRVRAVVSYCGIPDMRTSYWRFHDQLGSIFRSDRPIGRWGRAAFEWAAHRLGALPTDNPYIDTGEWIASVMGGLPGEIPDAYALGSPIHHVSAACPPSLLFQGTHDFTGIRQDVQRMRTALQDAGVPVVYVELPNTDHAFDIIPLNLLKTSPAAQAALYDLDRFLALMM
jgi:acetyl esterase/lipase